MDHKALYKVSKDVGCEWFKRAPGRGGGVTGTSYCCREDVRKLRGRWRWMVAAASCDLGWLFSRWWPNQSLTR